MRRTDRPILLLLAIISSLLPVIAVVPTAVSLSRSDVEHRVIVDLEDHGNEAAQYLARSLYTQWLQVQGLATYAGRSNDTALMRERLDTIKATNPQFAWLGIADPNGLVTVATGKILEGQNVNQREWFQFGIKQAYTGDVHQALLLQKYIAPISGEPMRMVDFATPVINSSGKIIGVLGAHANWKWVEELVQEANSADHQLVMLSQDGEVQIGSQSILHRHIATRATAEAARGVTYSGIETWPDGNTYLVTVIPKIEYRDLPDFGWRMVVLEPVSYLQRMQVPYRQVLATVIGSSVAIFGLWCFAIFWVYRTPE